MSTRTAAMIFGIVFLAIGIAGFIPGLTHEMPMGSPELAVDASYGQVFGLFPVNVLHNIVHILFGLWGLIAYKSLSASKGYFKAVAIIYAVLAIMGFIPGLATTFGLIPLFGNDIWLHILLAAVAAYFGWMHRDDRTHTAHDRL